MKMAITFEKVPANATASGVFIEENAQFDASSVFLNQKVLFLGHALETSAAEKNTARRITSAAQAKEIYGEGSQLALMAETAFGVSQNIEVYMVSIAEAQAATASVYTLDMTSVSTAPGTVYFYIGGVRISVVVTVGMSKADFFAAVIDQVTADVPFTVTVDEENTLLTLTSKWKGLSSNDLSVLLSPYDDENSSMPAGLVLTLVKTVSGAGEVNLVTALDNLGGEYYTKVVLPFTDNASLAAFSTAAERRIEPDFKRPFHAFVGSIRAYDDQLTWVSGLNYRFIVPCYVEASPTPAFLIAANSAMVSAVNDNVTPGRPFKNLVLSEVLRSPQSDYAYSAANALELAGSSVCYTNPSNQVVILDLVTSYKRTNEGIADDTWRYPEVLSLYQNKSYMIDNTFNSGIYTRAVFVDDEAVTDVDYAVRPVTVKNEMIGLVDTWVLRAWSKNRDQVVSTIEVELASASRINIALIDNMVLGGRIIAVRFGFELGV
jgi:phage tail sheath gpL-like